MGLPDTYALPQKYNDGYKLAGDGVAVPIVAHLRRHLFGPLIRANGDIVLQAV
jgi:DNA (cytosine-5)-methyltransferase 1